MNSEKVKAELMKAAEMQNMARKKELEAYNSPIRKFEEEFKQRKDILRKLGHIDSDDTVTLKVGFIDLSSGQFPTINLCF